MHEVEPSCRSAEPAPEAMDCVTMYSTKSVISRCFENICISSSAKVVYIRKATEWLFPVAEYTPEEI